MSSLLIVAAYLIGSLSSAVIVCRIMHLPDPRTKGSGNPGATNVLRIGGKIPAFLTLLGDLLKGVVPVLVAKTLGFQPLCLSLVIIAAFMGHLFPVFFGFRGGKGVATLLGALLALSWQAGLGWIIIWALITAIFRFVSLASLIATCFVPIELWFLTYNLFYTVTFACLALVLVYRHRRNIGNLVKGRENKL